MKKIMLISLLSAILISSTSCKKDKDETEATAVSVKIDGNTWTAGLSAAIYVSGSGQTFITASSGLSEQLQIIFKGNTTGTYNLVTGVEDAYCAFFYMSSDIYTTAFEDVPIGQIVITKYDQEKKLISGTFHFTAINYDDETKVFSEGVFTNVKFENQ
jgi:hypothetical protein